jgi:hypothetical protein
MAVLRATRRRDRSGERHERHVHVYRARNFSATLIRHGCAPPRSRRPHRVAVVVTTQLTGLMARARGA